MNPNLSSEPVPQGWAEKVNDPNVPLVDYENGGETLGVGSDSSAFEWKATSDGTAVWVSRAGVAPVQVLTDTSITEVSLAFDQTMNAHIAYVAGGVAKFYWWDTLANAYATMTLTGARSPHCCSDEKNPALSGDRDLILTYLKGTDLCVRLQRDRFGVEYVKVPNPANHEPITASTKIVQFGRNEGFRLQWRMM